MLPPTSKRKAQDPSPDPLGARLDQLIQAGGAVLLAERRNTCHVHDFATGRPLISRRTGKPRTQAVIERLFALPRAGGLPAYSYVCQGADGVLSDGSAATLDEALAQWWLPGPVRLLCPRECQARGWVVRR